jgi:uncharacterized protein (TIGR02302 family)
VLRGVDVLAGAGTEKFLDPLAKKADERAPPARQVFRAQVLLRRVLNCARGSLFWERLWPTLVPILTVLGLFLASSWFGLWLALPSLGRVIGLTSFVAFILLAVIPLFRLRVPNTADALRRLDLGTGEPHRPATTIADNLAANRHDTVSQVLWRVHVERALLASAGKFKAGWPSPKLSLSDPMALRALALMVVVASFFVAGDQRVKRVMAAFDWSGALAPANFRIDAWVSPPPYTSRPPIILPGLRPGESALAIEPVAAPVGSQVVIRSSGNVRFDLLRKGGLEDVSGDSRDQPPPHSTAEHRLVVKSNGSAAIHGVLDKDLVWQFTAIPDHAPTIEFTKPPQRQAHGALRLDYKMEDDYGVVDAKAMFALKDEPRTTKTRPLFPPPDFPLSLPQVRTRVGATQTTRDITEHPWAGADVTVTLLAHDEGGNEGRSAPRELTLPQRIFVKPLARALIEQRRNLALDSNAKSLVLTALDALTIAPDKFTPEAGIYLGLRSIYYDLRHATSDDALREVVARMWDMAAQIENDNVNATEQALRQAQEALRQALERGASDEELKKLMQQLRAAMDKFLQTLADELRKNPQSARSLDRNARVLSQQDLQSMLDQLENQARSGNKEAAQQLLEQLQSLLENLQMARPGASPQEGDDDMMSTLDELGDVIRKQQQLRDKTFKQGQDMQRDQGQNQLGDLRQDQQALKDRLSKLLEQLHQHGLGNPPQGQNGQPGQQGQMQDSERGKLGDAVDAMGEAEGELGEGNAEDAVGSQGRALETMRKGAQGLAQQMQQGTGPGRNGRLGRSRMRADQDSDPLGRPLRGREFGDDRSVKVPGEIEAQRARRILEELRKRYGETFRPQLELDYIERLLKDF